MILVDTLTFFIATSWKDAVIPHYFLEITKRLVEGGHRVVLLIDGQRRDVEDHHGNPAIYVWPSFRPTHFRDALFLRSLIGKYKPDCLLANFGSINVMMGVGWLLGVPCRIAWHHTLSTQFDLDTRVPCWKANLLKRRKAIFFRMATQLIANSSAANMDLQNAFYIPAQKVHVLYYALDDPVKGMRQADRPSNRPVHVLCVGRMHHSKGQDILLRAISLLRKEVPDFTVEFVGDGPYRDEYVALAQSLGLLDRCMFSGVVQHDEVMRKMAQADICVVPSRSEAFGLVAIESMAVGTPVIASRVGGIVESVRDGRDGFLFDSDDENSLAKKLQRLFGDHTLRQEMGRNARRRFLQKFEMAAVIPAQVAWLVQTVIDKKGD